MFNKVQATCLRLKGHAPATKRAATEDYVATVIDYNPVESDRKKLVESLAAENGYTTIPPYDHEQVVAG